MTTLLESAFNTFYDYDVDFEKIHSHEFVQGYKHHLEELSKVFGDVDFKNIDAKETKKIAQAWRIGPSPTGLTSSGTSRRQPWTRSLPGWG